MYTQNSIPLYTAKGEDSRSPLNFFYGGTGGLDEPEFSIKTYFNIVYYECIQPLNMRNIKTNRDWAGIFGNKRDEYR